MTKMYANRLAGILDNMGFFVRNTTAMYGVDDHTTLADSFTATIDTENGLFEMTVTDGMIVASKPNGTVKYWVDLTEARALAYIRQVLEFNHPVFHDEPEVEEAPEADGEDILEEVEPEVDEETVRRTVDYVARTYPRKLERDLDTINEGWDAFNHPEGGYVYQWALAVLEDGMGDGQVLPDGALDWLADACYGVLCPTAEDEPRFADLTPEQVSYLEGAGIGPVFVTPDQEEAVDRGLGLRDLDREGMRAVRNSVVRHLAPLATQARENGDWDLFDQLHANMSGICAVIDLRMAS